MTKAELLTLIRTTFFIEIQKKTGWGKNEVIQTYDECVRQALMKVLDEQPRITGDTE